MRMRGMTDCVPRRCHTSAFALRQPPAAMTLDKLKAFGQLAAAALVALAGLSVAVTAVWHAVDPEHVGLWSGPREFFFGGVFQRSDVAVEVHQLPGSTLYIVTVMVVGICWFVARELVGFARAGLARSRR